MIGEMNTNKVSLQRSTFFALVRKGNIFEVDIADILYVCGM